MALDDDKRNARYGKIINCEGYLYGDSQIEE